MKKNMLTIVILASSVVNLILSIVLVFSLVPMTNKTTALVEKVASVVDLEIDADKEKDDGYNVAELIPYTITYDKDVKINLKAGTDGKQHFGIISGIVVSFNPNTDDAQDVQTAITTADVYVQDIVKETIASYSYDEINQNTIKEEAIKKIQQKYDTKCVVDISLTGFMIA